MSLRRKGLWLLAFGLAGGCGACSDDPPLPDAGRIIDMNYDDPDTLVIPTQVIPQICSGNPMVCTGPTIIPGYTVHDEARWRLRIDGDGRKPWISVPESAYGVARMGQCWDTRENRAVEIGCDG